MATVIADGREMQDIDIITEIDHAIHSGNPTEIARWNDIYNSWIDAEYERACA